MQLDAVIFGGGVAGLWMLDGLVRQGCRAVLLEAHALGQGQTVAAQGIVHGGLKYTLNGLLTRSAANIRAMPGQWRRCLTGQDQPDLSRTRVRSQFCYLWRTESLSSRLGMIGARFGLQVGPRRLSPEERPAVLAGAPGTVARLDEPVIAPDSLLANLAGRHRSRILKIDVEQGLRIASSRGRVDHIRLKGRGKLVLEPRTVVLAAGTGNTQLRRLCGLSTDVMQRRALHMVMVRGELPELNGHCVDGAKTRVTITSDVTSDGRTVWQLGGQLAEDGVDRDERNLIQHARSELKAVLPALDQTGLEWATYRIGRAEAKMPNGARPDGIQILKDSNVLTAWPTKMALAPVLAREICERIPPAVPVDSPELDTPSAPDALAGWPRPSVAQPPWETAVEWHSTEEKQKRAA